MSAQTVISRPSSVRTNAGRRSVIQKSRLEAMDRPAVLGCLTQIRPQPRPITSEAVRKTRCRISGPWSRRRSKSMTDTTIKNVSSGSSPRGEMGQVYLASGTQVSCARGTMRSPKLSRQSNAMTRRSAT
jgi:hypothetical protein